MRSERVGQVGSFLVPHASLLTPGCPYNGRHDLPHLVTRRMIVMPRQNRRSRAVLRLNLVGLLALALLAVCGLGLTQVLAAPGATRSDPAPIGQEVTAGPWRLTVQEVVTGDDATQQVLAASSANVGPRDGFTYVMIRITATNDGDRPLDLDTDDFALTGDSGLVRRFVGALPPDPAIDATVAPGESHEGWVVLGAPLDEGDLLLVFDSVSLPGNWADRVFALQDGATVADAADAADKPNKAGQDPSDPAGVNTAVTNADWQVELLDVASCQEVFDMSDFRVQALTSEDADDEAPWVALKVRITNNRTGGDPAYLSPTAFMLSEPDGSSVSDVITLTAPNPDASGYYYPGASREGWVAFELPQPYADEGATLVRFLPFRTDQDARYLTFGDDYTDCRRPEFRN